MGGKNSVGSSSSGTSSGSAATDDVHNCNDSPPAISLTAPDNCATNCTITATVTQGTHQLTDPQYPNFPGTVTFTLAGNQIYTANVSDSPSTVSFNYTPTGNGTDSLTATVTDSVLYSGTASQQMAYSAPVAGPSNFTGVVNGSFVNFSWSGGSGTYTVARADNGNPLCSSATGSCQVGKSGATANTGTAVVLKDTQTQQVLASYTVTN
jgi:hypothetical protein